MPLSSDVAPAGLQVPSSLLLERSWQLLENHSSRFEQRTMAARAHIVRVLDSDGTLSHCLWPAAPHSFLSWE